MRQKNDGYLRFRCKECGQRLKVRETLEGGNVVRCPRCGISVNVPLSNIEAIAKGTDMPETGDPGRLNIDADLLLKRLGGEEAKGSGPGSIGGPPTLRRDWSPDAALGRIQELDQLAAAVNKIDQGIMGRIQRLYRNKELRGGVRAEQVKDAALQRGEEVGKLAKVRIGVLKGQVDELQVKHERLTGAQLENLAKLKRTLEAMQLYARYVLGADV